MTILSNSVYACEIKLVYIGWCYTGHLLLSNQHNPRTEMPVLYKPQKMFKPSIWSDLVKFLQWSLGT